MNQSNTDDLPEELKKQLRLKQAKGVSRRFIQEALKDLGETNLNQILIWIYQEKGEILKRSGAGSALIKLIDDGIAYRPSYGTYALVHCEEIEPEDPAEEPAPSPEAAVTRCEYCNGQVTVENNVFDEKYFCSAGCIKKYRKEFEDNE